MDLQTFILVGRSGCGKSTHAGLLAEYLKKKDPARTVYSLETGKHFRDFIQESGFSNIRSRELYQKADLQPSFLAVYLWAREFIKNLRGDEHLIIDGTPRYVDEARMLTNAMRFYGRTPVVIYLNVSRAYSEAKLKGRGRADDLKEEDVRKRLDWFETSVVPAIEYLKQDPLYRFIEVNGEGTPEEIIRRITDTIFT